MCTENIIHSKLVFVFPLFTEINLFVEVFNKFNVIKLKINRVEMKRAISETYEFISLLSSDV